MRVGVILDGVPNTAGNIVKFKIIGGALNRFPNININDDFNTFLKFTTVI